MKFEDNLARLEVLVRKMESGEANLDELIAAFEEGRQLAETCRRDLESIKLRIEKVTAAGVEPVKIVANESGEPDIEM